MTGQPSPPSTRRPRLLLAGLALVFVGPLLVAWFLNQMSDTWRPSGTVEHGTLITPPRPLSSAALRALEGDLLEPGFFERKWTLLYLAPADCARSCQETLYAVRQARLALGKDMERVHRLYAAPEGADRVSLAALSRDWPGLRVVAAPSGWARAARQGTDPLILVDPQGLAMMSYPADADAEDILKDLKRLLKISQLG